MASKVNRPKVTFPPQLERKIRDEHERTGIPMAEIIRRAVADWFDLKEHRMNEAAPVATSPAVGSDDPAMAVKPETVGRKELDFLIGDDDEDLFEKLGGVG